MGTGPTCQRDMGMGMGTGSSPWVRVRVWVRNFAPGYGYYKSGDSKMATSPTMADSPYKFPR